MSGLGLVAKPKKEGLTPQLAPSRLADRNRAVTIKFFGFGRNGLIVQATSINSGVELFLASR